MAVTGPDEKRARKAIVERFGKDVQVAVCGDVPREVLPRRCDGQMEREPGRLQLRYAMQDEEHLHEIVVAETDDSGHRVRDDLRAGRPTCARASVESPYHVYLDQPLGERVVIDAVSELPIPYFNVYDGIEERVAKMRGAS